MKAAPGLNWRPRQRLFFRSTLMSETVTRRRFLGTAAAVAGGALIPAAANAVAAPAIIRSRVSGFAAVGSANGIRGVTSAVELMTQGPHLDAAVEGVKIQEPPRGRLRGCPTEGVVQPTPVHARSQQAGRGGSGTEDQDPERAARLVLGHQPHPGPGRQAVCPVLRVPGGSVTPSWTSGSAAGPAPGTTGWMCYAMRRWPFVPPGRPGCHQRQGRSAGDHHQWTGLEDPRPGG